MTTPVELTAAELRIELSEVLRGLRAGTIEPKDAVEINNTAGKIISTAKVQVAYHALRGESPNIPFLTADIDGPAGRALSAPAE